MNNTILVVDDNEVNIDVLVNILKEFDVIASLSGKSALEISEQEDVDLILLDIMMPEMDGFEVCDKLKSSPKTQNIPVIFLSAKDSHEDIKKGLEHGAVDYVTKPFNPDELLSRVNTHLELRSYQKSLEKRVKEEIEKNRLKEQMMYQNSKQAAFGELLMHIAHQWKQPLATLNSINMLNKAKLKRGIKITDEDYLNSSANVDEQIEFMSKTINTFQNFYKPSNENESFYLLDCVNKVLSILDPTFSFDHIRVYTSSNEDDRTFGNINEISQVIFSILNNSRDVFKDRKIQNPKINIEIHNKKITISDNAGGINDEILKDIFSPFVSTNNSTGIGLYISKNIVEKNSGTIHASNSVDGAIFTIEFLTWIN